MVTLIDGDLYQWDTGRVVLINPGSAYTIHEIHFTTRKMDFAYVANTYTENGSVYCAIPNIILQQYYDIYCYEVRENENGEESVSTTVLKVIKRNRPADYIYTETEKFKYEELERRIKDLEDAFEEVKTTSIEASALANEAYAMAETANATASSFNEKIEELQDQIGSSGGGSTGGSNNVVEF